MAILDERTEFCDSLAYNGTGGFTTVGTNLVGDVIDLEVARDIGNGQPVYCVINVETAITTTTTGSIKFQLASDAQAAIATDTQTIHWTSATTATATNAGPTAGTRYVVALPLEDPDYERYLGVQAVVASAAVNGGAISAFLTLDPVGWKPYSDFE